MDSIIILEERETEKACTHFKEYKKLIEIMIKLERWLFHRRILKDSLRNLLKFKVIRSHWLQNNNNNNNSNPRRRSFILSQLLKICSRKKSKTYRLWLNSSLLRPKL
jgi:hypothetical protein